VIAWSAFGFVVIGNVLQQALNTCSEAIKATLAILFTRIGLIIIGIMIGRRQKNNG
jgi:hypothetical protein